MKRSKARWPPSEEKEPQSASNLTTFKRTDLFTQFVHSFSSPPLVGSKNHTYILFMSSGALIKYTLASTAELVSNRKTWWMILPWAYCPFSPPYVMPLNKMKRFAVKADKHRGTIYLMSLPAWQGSLASPAMCSTDLCLHMKDSAHGVLLCPVGSCRKWTVSTLSLLIIPFIIILWALPFPCLWSPLFFCLLPFVSERWSVC